MGEDKARDEDRARDGVRGDTGNRARGAAGMEAIVLST